ncbi:hypothetical protein Tco_0585645 [Tanacetum coccineum]
MANLEFCDTHNMVAYLKKIEGIEGFHQIVDFLNTSHIRYALTKNPTIYVSLISQFWQTATTRSLDNEEIELTATIDGKVKIVNEASVRRHLQLADYDGISSLPTTKIFKQLSLMGNMKRDSKGFTKEGIPLFPTMLVQGTVVQGEVSTHLVESHHIPISAPSTSQPPISPTSRRTTRQESVGSGNIDKTPTIPHDSPLLRVNTLESDDGSMTLQELMVFYTTLSKKVESLEAYLKQTKKVYGAAYTKLLKKVKKLEKAAKSSQTKKRARIVVFDDDDDLEDPSKQGRKIDEIDQDPNISLVQHDAEIQGRHGQDMEFNFDVSTDEPVFIVGASVTTTSVSTASPIRVSTADDITLVKTLVYIRRSAAKDKCKGKMAEPEPVQTKIKLQQEQERLGYEAAVRLQAELEEEERQGIASVHESASSFNVEEW